MGILQHRNWLAAACLLQAAFWIGLASPTVGDEPSAPLTPQAQARAAPALPQREFTPAEQAQLAEAERLNARLLGLYRAGKFAEAIPLAERELAIDKRVLGEQHPYYATGLDNLATLYKDAGDYTKAEPLYIDALAIRKRVLGEKDPDYAISLNNLAALYQAEGKYGKVEPLLIEALAIRKQVSGEKNPDYATSLNNLAAVYYTEGDYPKAEPLFNKALAIRKKVLGEKHPDYAQSLNNLAELYEAEGNYAKAEPTFIEALAVRNEVLGERHPDSILSLNNLAMLYEAEGNYAKAAPLLIAALVIRKQVLGEKHPDYARSLSNLALLYQAERSYAKAEPLFIEALAIRKQVLGEKHPDYAASLDYLAGLYEDEGYYAKAEPLCVEALAIDEQALRHTDPDYLTSLNDLAELYHAEGNYAKAEPLLADALAISKRVLGERHPDYAISLNNLAGCEIGLHWYSAAAGHAQLAADTMQQHLERTAAIQSEHQQLLMVENVRHAFSVFLSASRSAGVAPEAAYDEVLKWKGAVTNRQALVRTLRPDLSKDPGAAALYGRLEAASSELAVLTNRVPTGPQGAGYQQRLDELGDQVEELQAKLASISAPFAEQRVRQKRTATQLREALPAGTALVDLIEYDDYGWIEQKMGAPIWRRRTAAFVVEHDRPVTRIDLGLSADIDGAIESWRDGFGRGEGSQQAAAMLRRRVWVPLEFDLAGESTILISPDGELAKLPWGALPGKDPRKFLIEERAIAVIAVPQALPELLANSADPTAPPSLLLVGDVDYGGDPGMLPANGENRRAPRDGSMIWAPLPGTRTEILAIRDSFEQKFPEGKVEQLCKRQATAEAVRRSAPSFRFLHFATHGFFADPKFRSATAPSDMPESGFDRAAMLGRATFEHPDLLSGLVLAGANRPVADGQADGILTAMEVSGLDLSHVELATLSACETGLGESAGGEGLLGLQRAFQIAGAKTVVASLWKVPDRATKVLMSRFYDNLWDKKMGKLESLMEAQRWLLREGRKQPELLRGENFIAAPEDPSLKSGRMPPRYWAAFELSGDWR